MRAAPTLATGGLFLPSIPSHDLRVAQERVMRLISPNDLPGNRGLLGTALGVVIAAASLAGIARLHGQTGDSARSDTVTRYVERHGSWP